MTAADRRMAPRRSSPCKLLIIVPHANREHRRDAYATLGSATCLTPRPPTFHVARHSTKLLSLTLRLVDFFGFLLADRLGDTSRSALKSPLRNVQTPEPGTSCLATISLSLRDKSHSPIEAPRIKLALVGLKPWAEPHSPFGA